ncbi:hypothetical protein [Litorilituus lipolyticus]|uniref:Uncharacterized protein n=1 Tax=Litorilituus lipolyticus TaxID=2491017 RepID=A0A502L0D7_9GAMM|nr:hypothetical protein [Litorilituus lipolyticus]TPH15741.1 hypothetical protein EPA86_09220 [Litorilituus lipolyticus]
MKYEDDNSNFDCESKLEKNNSESLSTLAQIKHLLKDLIDDAETFKIRVYKGVKERSLIAIWKMGRLKGNQSIYNNTFLQKFSEVSHERKLEFIKMTTTNDVSKAFVFSSDEMLYLLFNYCSIRAEKMLLVDILSLRYSKEISNKECFRIQFKLLKTMGN